MILFADADAVRPAHIVDFFALLGGGQKDAGLDGSGRPVAQLAILPGLTHYNINSSPALALAVTPFLDAPCRHRSEATACVLIRMLGRVTRRMNTLSVVRAAKFQRAFIA